MKIEIITHYGEDDEDFSCDYYSVDVKIDGKMVRHYSDAYHDRGAEKSKAFVDGVLFASGTDTEFGEKLPPSVKRISVADGET